MFTWAATVICITGTVINIWRINACFCLWIVGEAMWLSYDLLQDLHSRAILDGVGLVLAVIGAIKNPIFIRG